MDGAQQGKSAAVEGKEFPSNDEPGGPASATVDGGWVRITYEAGRCRQREGALTHSGEAGLDGLWIHRVLEGEGIESHVADPASIAISRRRRRAKTDRIDGEAFVRTLMAYKRGEPRVCAMVRAPSPEDEDRRRACRERKALTNERAAHVNRLKGLLFSQGVTNYEPLRKDRRRRLEELASSDDLTIDVRSPPTQD
jgi:transposase